ncbi:hypothetical protein B9Z19DRAFT_1073910 [Tuber borchii]|uniref:Yippee domain-containing protein n=1 Tax=Tuber borchii TaxID=42251 RepID=A0A2T7A5F1_TUBBO|nr:hypothetical protein B9Z19DRAFT_1073910 [Tuber borchii]
MVLTLVLSWLYNFSSHFFFLDDIGDNKPLESDLRTVDFGEVTGNLRFEGRGDGGHRRAIRCIQCDTFLLRVPFSGGLRMEQSR